MAKSECPFCGELTSVDGKLYLGKNVVCGFCEGTSQVARVAPLELDYYYEGYEGEVEKEEMEEVEYDSYDWEDD